ncbi:hypothetical protein HMPREF9182_1822 [Streptococcus sp. oral taxon 056 str. F0418]|nr:hypothetical protein HMPREF9182_1822 [Streptococcus sp. oral taxon 056 str. F0418]
MGLFFRDIKILKIIAFSMGILLSSLPILFCAYFLWTIWTV